MLSVLPLACGETAPWASCLSRKRPLLPSCLGEYRSVAGRAKRLRQELLRLREWEQLVQQEALGAQEGIGDSCDESIAVEPPAPLLPVLQSASGQLFVVEDASDCTTSASCGHASRVTSLAGERQTSGFGTAVADLSQANLVWGSPDGPLQRPAQRQAASAQGGARLPLPVHNVRTISLPQQFVFHAGSTVFSSGPLSGTLALVQEEPGPVEGEEEDGSEQWGASSCDHTDTGSPLEEMWAGSGSCGGSVQQAVPEQETDAVSESRVPGGHRGSEEVVEEDPSLEETSRRMESGSEIGGCQARAASSMLLPPLPAQFVGMPMSLRQRLLDFFVQASDILGLNAQSLYLAAVFLDCCWVEEGVRRSIAAGSLCFEQATFAGAELQQVALACLLHAYLQTRAVDGSRSAKFFLRLLSAAAPHHPRVAAMLPAKAAALEEKLLGLKELLPMAVAEGTLSSSARVYGSLLELRKACSQKEHLLVFVSQLCAVGYRGLPSEVSSAANCCLVTGAVLLERADSDGERGCKLQEHHEEHLEALQAFLCSAPSLGGYERQASTSSGDGVSDADCGPQCSVEISI